MKLHPNPIRRRGIQIPDAEVSVCPTDPDLTACGEISSVLGFVSKDSYQGTALAVP